MIAACLNLRMNGKMYIVHRNSIALHGFQSRDEPGIVISAAADAWIIGRYDAPRDESEGITIADGVHSYAVVDTPQRRLCPDNRRLDKSFRQLLENRIIALI